MTMILIQSRLALLFCAGLIFSCDRSPAPAPGSAPAAALQASLRAEDPSCRLPLENFERSYLRFRGNVIDYPMNRVIVDRAGRVLWNARPIGARVLEEFVRVQANAVPPVLLVISPEGEASCAAVRQVLAVALRAGCRRNRCVFEWPGTDEPPPPAEGRVPSASGLRR